MASLQKRYRNHNDGAGRLLGCLHGLHSHSFYPSCQGSPGSFASYFDLGFQLGLRGFFISSGFMCVCTVVLIFWISWV